MSIRDFRQLQLANMWIESGCRGIIHACPRFGKIRTTIIILNRQNYKRVLIAYPDRKIKASWDDDFEELKYDVSRITYTTHMSLKKHVSEPWDLIVLDEIHLLSQAQVDECAKIAPDIPILGLSGTLSSVTEKWLAYNLKLPVVAVYPIKQAIEEGVVTDYEITIVRTDLDNLVRQKYQKEFLSEKGIFDKHTWIIDKLNKDGKDSKLQSLARMRIIQYSLAKQRATIELLQQFNNERVLVFCGLTEIADNLGIPSYHSKSEERHIFDEFATGTGNQLAVVRIGNTGVTYKPLNKVIINYFDSNPQNLAQKINRAMSMEYDNPDKKAQIWIVCTTEDVEKRWLLKALEFFDKTKIKWI